MKKILITGANSYIGTSFEKYMQQWPEEYQVDTSGNQRISVQHSGQPDDQQAAAADAQTT